MIFSLALSDDLLSVRPAIAATLRAGDAVRVADLPNVPCPRAAGLVTRVHPTSAAVDDYEVLTDSGESVWYARRELSLR